MGTGNGETTRQHIGLALGLILFVFFLAFLPIRGEDADATAKLNRMTAVALLMAVWWITQAIPIPATALLPLALFPLLGLVDSKTLAPIYMNDNIFLFVGGFLIAIALERWQLARRIALTIVLAFGSSPRRLILGFMVATAFLSMWISNTATAMMMFPIGLSVILLARELGRENAGNKAEGTAARASLGAFPAALMLSIAYAANIGGIATKIGTPPNVVFFEFFEQQFPNAPQPTFTGWMMLGLPFAVVFLAVSWLVLTRLVFRFKKLNIGAGRGFIRDELRKMGPLSTAEWQVLVVFAVTALLWITRGQIKEIGFPGWVRGLGLIQQFGDKTIELVRDGGVSITMALTLFLLPSRKKRGERLLDAGSFQKVPWGIVLLFGGGFALAKGMSNSGLSTWLGGQLEVLGGVWPPAIVASVSGLLTFLTELTSNTATTNMVLPILKGVSIGGNIHPLLLMIPATVSASCAFMLPVATPPNAIVFGSGYIPLGKMIKTGLILNLIGIVLVTVTILTLGTLIFNITGGMPQGWVAP
jgi:sodium-dependent dicarboxylate transporter 2/3/5